MAFLRQREHEGVARVVEAGADLGRAEGRAVRARLARMLLSPAEPDTCTAKRDGLASSFTSLGGRQSDFGKLTPVPAGEDTSRGC